MKCPVCAVDLMMSERQGVEIDYCPQCRGIWLDRGELDKIIERSAAPVSRPAENYRDYHEHDDHHSEHGYGKRKRSFLSDLFD